MMIDDDDLNVLSREKDAFLHALLRPSFTAVNLAVSTSVWSSLIKRGGTDRRCLLFAYIYLRYFLIVDILSAV